MDNLVWDYNFGSAQSVYCPISGCNNIITKNRPCNLDNHDLQGVYEIDHKQPLSKGGSDTLNNKRPICCSCNREKSDSTSSRWF